LIFNAVKPLLIHHMSVKLTRISIALAAILAIVTVAPIFAYNASIQAKTNSGEQAQIFLDYGELITMPSTTVYAELYCVGSFIDRGNWTGVRLGLVIGEAGQNQKAETVELYASDGYWTRIPYSVAMREDVIIAYEKDGSALVEVTRLVVPDANGGEWVSNIRRIIINFS
jgi:DMSO/TMAO reductase YedYZ molybdopterin-dependent catalytic subunit